MAKRKKTNKKERRTYIGRIASISPVRPTKDGAAEVQNLDIEIVDNGEKAYVELAFWNTEGLAAIRGLALSSDCQTWEKLYEPLRIGMRILATGAFQMKEWTGKKVGKQLKPSLSIYSAHQVKVASLPPLPK